LKSGKTRDLLKGLLNEMVGNKKDQKTPKGQLKKSSFGVLLS